MSEQDRQHPDKAGFRDDDVEAHRLAQAIEDGDDVEGHRNRPDRNRPDLLSDPERNRSGLVDEDVEGHRIPGSNVQPPRDADLGGTEH